MLQLIKITFKIRLYKYIYETNTKLMENKQNALLFIRISKINMKLADLIISLTEIYFTGGEDK